LKLKQNKGKGKCGHQHFRARDGKGFGSWQHKLKNRPVVIGSGPAGLFGGLVLAQNGYRPLILERGECVEKRTQIVNRYWTTGELDPEPMYSLEKAVPGLFLTENLPPG